LLARNTGNELSRSLSATFFAEAHILDTFDTRSIDLRLLKARLLQVETTLRLFLRTDCAECCT
jgi:hypothetical protein